MKHNDQRGMASIIITMVTMVIITLIVVGFATISRREQRQSLDQLLSSQAFYAAESGVEDARSVIKKAIDTGQPVINKDNCTTNNTNGLYPESTQMSIDATYQVQYTCLKVDAAPDTLRFDAVSANSVVIPLSAGSPITSVKVTWSPSSSSGSPMSGCPSAAPNSFKPQTGWTCGHGVLRADLVPTGGAMTSASLSSGLISGFFVPVTAGSTGSLAYTGANIGKANVVAADCSAGTSCTAIIDNIGVGQNKATLRLNSIYQSSNISVQALNGTTAQKISGVQAVIDSTGRASDVLRRIQVRVPVIQTGGLLPGSALTSNGAICKRFSITPTYFNIPSDITDFDSQNDMCKTKTVGTVSASSCSVTNDIVFTLDTSNSMKLAWDGTTRNDKLRSVTKNFIQNSNISTAANGNHAAITSFNNQAYMGQNLTGNQASLTSAVNAMQNDWGTYYLSGLDMAKAEFSSTRVRTPGVGKVLIFVSDGAPTDASDNPATQTDKNNILNRTNAMKSQGVRIYTIGIGDTTSSTDQIDVQLLSDMAGNGGSYADARNQTQLESIISQISDAVQCN